MFPFSEVIHESTTFKLTNTEERLNKKNQVLNLTFLFFFYILRSNAQDNK